MNHYPVNEIVTLELDWNEYSTMMICFKHFIENVQREQGIHCPHLWEIHNKAYMTRKIKVDWQKQGE